MTKLPDPVYTFEDRTQVQEQFQEQRAEHKELCFDFFSRELSHALGAKYFWDLTPADQKHFYAASPPQLVDGSIAPWMGPGTPNWPVIAGEFLPMYERHVNRYWDLVTQEAKKQADAA